MWAINCADEIKTELIFRSKLRHEARSIAMLVFKKKGGGRKDTDNKMADIKDYKEA